MLLQSLLLLLLATTAAVIPRPRHPTRLCVNFSQNLPYLLFLHDIYHLYSDQRPNQQNKQPSEGEGAFIKSVHANVQNTLKSTVRKGNIQVNLTHNLDYSLDFLSWFQLRARSIILLFLFSSDSPVLVAVKLSTQHQLSRFRQNVHCCHRQHAAGISGMVQIYGGSGKRSNRTKNTKANQIINK